LQPGLATAADSWQRARRARRQSKADTHQLEATYVSARQLGAYPTRAFAHRWTPPQPVRYRRRSPDDLRKTAMQLTPREFDKLLIYMMAEVAQKRLAQGIKLNYPEAVAMISAKALDGARVGQTIEEVTQAARGVLTKDDVMEGVADLVQMVQVEAVFTDGSRLVTVHTPIQ
jgi:urease subunit gamma